MNSGLIQKILITTAMLFLLPSLSASAHEDDDKCVVSTLNNCRKSDDRSSLSERDDDDNDNDDDKNDATKAPRITTPSARPTTSTTSTTSTTAVSIGSLGRAQKSDNKILICHANSPYNYVLISVNKNGLKGHEKHKRDIIPVPPGGCPVRATTTTISPTTSIVTGP